MHMTTCEEKMNESEKTFRLCFYAACVAFVAFIAVVGACTANQNNADAKTQQACLEKGNTPSDCYIVTKRP